MSILRSKDYRKDIQGLRAVAVLAVILYHLGYLPNGYLGVDIFFVISGYLITKIVYNETLEDRFSIIRFYLRRIRRIIPLILFTTLIALLIGLFVMLPDDLENLSQSVFATNCFANNILLLITTGNYWDIVNEYKPLMHTWSLGIEEQFYFLYPLIFFFFNSKNSRWLIILLTILTIISFSLFISSSDGPSKFYLIQFRFFELSIGGLCAIIFNNKLISARYKIVPLSFILFILVWPVHIAGDVKLICIVIASAATIIMTNRYSGLCVVVLENKLMVGVGTISFSLYMWHQVAIAYTRYFITGKITGKGSILLFLLILILSILSYYLVEQPFRDKRRMNTKVLLITIGSVFVLLCSASLYIYYIAGIVRDVPELEIYRSASHNTMNFADAGWNTHNIYNTRIFYLDKGFSESKKIKILIIGNSFARDWANVLLESKFKDGIEISYVYDINDCKDINTRLQRSQYIFFSEPDKMQLNVLAHKYAIDTSKVWNVGTKNFGSNNGIFYNRRRSINYCTQKTSIDREFIKRNNELKKQWGNRYIDLIGMIEDNNGLIPVFTPDCKFISQDCRHLTHAGATYFGKLLAKQQTLKIE